MVDDEDEPLKTCCTKITLGKMVSMTGFLGSGEKWGVMRSGVESAKRGLVQSKKTGQWWGQGIVRREEE